MMRTAIWKPSEERFLDGNDRERDRKANRLTWFAWIGFYFAVCLVFFWKETGLPVNNAYAVGAERWLARTRLYDYGCGFIYFPQSAIAYAPFRMLPFAAEQVAWRFVSVGLFAAGIYRLCRLVDGTRVGTVFSLTSLLVLPKAWTCAYSGQATLPMVGLSMLALAEIATRRWWRASLLAVAALAFKPLALVVVLLIAALHRPLLVRTGVVFALFWLFPYAIRDAAYVNSQYLIMLTTFDKAASIGLSPEWTQLFSLCSLAGIDVSPGFQTCLRVVASAGTLLLCWRVCRRENAIRDFTKELPQMPGQDLQPGWLVVLALSTAYLLLFNPRSENNSYVMLSPVLGLSCARAWLVTQNSKRGALLASGAIAIVAGHELCGWLTPSAGFVWLCPLVCLVFAIDCVVGIIRCTATVTIAENELAPESERLPFRAPAPAAAERDDLASAA